MDGLQWKTLLKWIIWGYPYFRKHPYIQIIFNSNEMTNITELVKKAGDSGLRLLHGSEMMEMFPASGAGSSDMMTTDYHQWMTPGEAKNTQVKPPNP